MQYFFTKNDSRSHAMTNRVGRHCTLIMKYLIRTVVAFTYRQNESTDEIFILGNIHVFTEILVCML